MCSSQRKLLHNTMVLFQTAYKILEGKISFKMTLSHSREQNGEWYWDGVVPVNTSVDDDQ